MCIILITIILKSKVAIEMSVLGTTQDYNMSIQI